MDGPKQRRPDSNLVMDDEVRLSEKAFPLATPARSHSPKIYNWTIASVKAAITSPMRGTQRITISKSFS